MRLLLSASTLALCLAFLPSCASMKGDVTKGDIATFKLRDLTRFGQPHLVRISPKEVEEIDSADVKNRRVASLDPKHLPAPVNFVPPRLPNGRIAFDGSILPPKEGGSAAFLDSPGFLPGRGFGGAPYPAAAPQNFSIE